MLHRDLKPANIMIDGRGQVRITDFGLARLAEDGREGEIAGTPAYMAPEQLARGEATIQSDLFASGLILYELSTGQQVHKTGSILELLRAHQESSLTNPSAVVDDMNPSVERVILRCLEKEPHQRPKSAAALPGGDPLAAGETPSPEMVANAGTSEQIPVRIGLAWLGALLAGLIAAAFLLDHTGMLASARLDKEPAELEVLSRETIRRLGYDAPEYRAKSRALGFDPVVGRDPQQRKGGSTLVFWYRQSAEPLLPRNMLAWMVTSDDPPANAPAMLGVRLDPEDGRLLEFWAVPAIDPVTKGPLAAKPVLPEDLFREAKLDWESRIELDASEPFWYPQARADKQLAWRAHWQDHEAEVLVRASFDRESLVFFGVSTPDEAAPKSASVAFGDKAQQTKPYLMRTIEGVAGSRQFSIAVPHFTGFC